MTSPGVTAGPELFVGFLKLRWLPGTHLPRLPAVGDNGAMKSRQIQLFAERLTIGIIGGHKVWFAAGCLYLAWKIAPFWVAVFPAAMGFAFLSVGMIEVLQSIRA